MGAQAQAQPRLLDGGQVGAVEIFLAQVHPIGARIDGMLPMVVDEQQRARALIDIAGACACGQGEDIGAVPGMTQGIPSSFTDSMCEVRRREDSSPGQWRAGSCWEAGS